MSEPDRIRRWWRKFRSLPTKWQVAAWAVLAVVLIVAGTVSGEEDSGSTRTATETAATPTEAATTPVPSPTTPAPSPTAAVEEKIMAEVKSLCPTERELGDQSAAAACTDVTGYDFNGTSLTVKTNLYPKEENKDVAKEIAAFTFAAIQCGDSVGARYKYMDVTASNGQFLVYSYRPPLCDR